MPPTEKPLSGQRTPEKFRDRLQAEIKADSAFEHTEDDTLQYVALSTGVQALLLMTQQGARGIETELDEDDKRADGDKKKLSAADRQKYEDYLSEVQSWTFLFPHVLKTTRGVQYSPDVLRAMEKMTTDIAKTMKLAEAIQKQRLGIILRSDTGDLGRSAEDLVRIATYEWLQRMAPPPRADVKRDPALLKEHLKAIGILNQQEGQYEKNVKETEASQKTAREKTDEERTLEGTARVTQGLPGAELLLDRPEVSLRMWRRLLIEGGPREKKNGAAQLGEAVDNFKAQFLEKAALEAFESQVKGVMRELVLANKVEQEKSKRILGFLLGEFGEAGVDRLTTHPEEFDAVTDAILEKVRDAFAQISTPEHRKTAEQLGLLLKNLEEGKDVDSARLEKLIDDYIELQKENRDLMAAVQRWQVTENALRVGGRGEQSRAEQMIDQVTRMGEGKSGIEWLRRMAPYGSFQTRGYVSPDGRFVLLPPSGDRLSEKGIGGHIIEAGKTAVAFPAAAAVSYLALRLAGYAFLPKAARGPGVAVALAEFQMAVTKGAAHQEVIGMGVERMNAAIQDLLALEQGTDRDGRPVDPRLKKEFARQAGNELFSALLITLQAAKASNNPLLSERSQAAPKPAEVLEAHLYANQLLNALGFPGYHQLPDGMKLPAADDKTLSPEARLFLQHRTGPERSDVIRRTRAELAELRKYQDRLTTERSPGNLAPEKSAAKRMLDSTFPPVTRALPEMKELMESDEFKRDHKTFEQTESRTKILKQVGEWMTLKTDMNVALRPLTAPTGAESLWRRYVSGRKPTAREIVGEPKRLQWEPKLQAVQGTKVQRFLDHVKSLQDNPPTNAEIQEWYDDAGLARVGTKEIEAFYGPEGDRKQMVDRFLTAWLELHAQAPTFVDEPKGDK